MVYFIGIYFWETGLTKLNRSARLDGYEDDQHLCSL